MLLWQEMASHHLTLCQTECNLAGNDGLSPMTMGGQYKPYGHHECYIVDKVVLIS